MKLIKEYCPDVMIQIGVAGLSFNARTTCSSNMLYGLTCDTDWIAVLLILFISVGLNIVVRRFLSVAYSLKVTDTGDIKDESI